MKSLAVPGSRSTRARIRRALRRRPPSNLVAHARFELERLGEDPDTIRGLLRVIQAFADMGHSGGSASIAVPMISQLLQFLPLTALTTDPAEWNEISREMSGGEDLWQNRRDSRAFSHDGGRTYYLVDDRQRTIIAAQAAAR